MWRQVSVVRCMTLVQVLPDLPSFKWNTWPPELQEAGGGQRKTERQILSNYYKGQCCGYFHTTVLPETNPKPLMCYLDISVHSLPLSYSERLHCFHRAHHLKWTRKPNHTIRVSVLPSVCPHSLKTLRHDQWVSYFPPVFSVKHIRRHLWYSQRVEIKAESLSTSCSATTHFPWQLAEGWV